MPGRRWLMFLAWLLSLGHLNALSLLTYNVDGNSAADWSTNAAQVQAIGRQVAYLQPDVVTFNEIPFRLTWQMTNFVAAFLPGHFLAANSGTDGFVRSVILSRYPIVRSQKWLDGVTLDEFGYDGRFARDLFEAEIEVPGFPVNLHVFTTHLKALGDSDSARRRAAEASAVSNYFATIFLPSHGDRPYVLTGDLNEDIDRPPSSSRQPIERIANRATGLWLTTPLNPVTGASATYSPQTRLTVRLDYILPCGLLFSNIAVSQVFRTDVLDPLPPPLAPADSRTASDHLPVWMVFGNPYEEGFRIAGLAVTNGIVFSSWESIPGRRYDLETSTDLVSWAVLASNLIGNSTTLQWSNPIGGEAGFLRVRRWP